VEEDCASLAEYLANHECANLEYGTVCWFSTKDTLKQFYVPEKTDDRVEMYNDRSFNLPISAAFTWRLFRDRLDKLEVVFTAPGSLEANELYVDKTLDFMSSITDTDVRWKGLTRYLRSRNVGILINNRVVGDPVDVLDGVRMTCLDEGILVYKGRPDMLSAGKRYPMSFYMRIYRPNGLLWSEPIGQLSEEFRSWADAHMGTSKAVTTNTYYRTRRFTNT